MKIHIKENTGNKGSNLFNDISQLTQQIQLGSAYWKQQARKPIFTKELAKFNKKKAEESRQRINEFKKWAATKGKRLVLKNQKDYLTTSNDNTWVENRNPMVKASKLKNPHLTERSIKGAKAHAAWEKEHPVLNTWGNILGAVPFAVASAPLATAAGSGIVALGDAAAATSAGQAITAGLTPLVAAASTNVAGAPLYTWADAGLSSLFGAHGIQTAIDEGGISPTTALEIAPLGRLVKPMWDAGKQGLQYTTKAIKNGYATTASKNGVTIGNLEHFNWGRDSKGNLKLIDLYVIKNPSERNQPFGEKQLTEHVQGNDAVTMFKEYGGEPIPEKSINGEQLRKYVPEVRERYGIVGNNNITDEEIAQALYKHSKELGGNTAAVNALGEPLLLFRGDTKAYTELRNNHHESGGSEDNILGTLFLDRTGIGEGWGPDRYLYLSNKYGLVMAPYRLGIETENFSLLKPKFKEDYLYEGSDAGYIDDEQISYPYWSYTSKSGETIQGNKIASDNFSDGTVNHLNAFIVRTPKVRDITNEVVVTGGSPGTPPPFNWLIPKESRIGQNLHDVRLALNKAVLEEAKKHNQGLLKSDRGSYWRGEEHEKYDYFALPDFNVRGAKHLLPYDLRIPRNWKDKNIYRGLIPLTTGYTLYNLFNQPLQQL